MSLQLGDPQLCGSKDTGSRLMVLSPVQRGKPGDVTAFSKTGSNPREESSSAQKRSWKAP